MAYCALTATVYKHDGVTLKTGARLNVYQSLGTVIGKLITAYTFISAGVWYPLLRFERLSSVSMQLDDGPISVVEIPDLSSAVLQTENGLLHIAEATGPGNFLLQGGGHLVLQGGGNLELQT